MLRNKPSSCRTEAGGQPERKKDDDDDDADQDGKSKRSRKARRRSSSKAKKQAAAKKKAAQGKERQPTGSRHRKRHAIPASQSTIEHIPFKTRLYMEQTTVKRGSLGFNKKARGKLLSLFKSRRKAPATTVRIPVCTVPHVIVPVGSRRDVLNASH